MFNKEQNKNNGALNTMTLYLEDVFRMVSLINNVPRENYLKKLVLNVK